MTSIFVSMRETQLHIKSLEKYKKHGLRKINNVFFWEAAWSYACLDKKVSFAGSI